MKNASQIGVIIMGIFWAICLVYVCATGEAILDITVCSLFANVIYMFLLFFMLGEDDDKNGYV